MEVSAPCFREPAVPNDAWGRYGESADQVGWLDLSTLPRARAIREYLNRSLAALPPDAAKRLCHRLRRDPPFGRPYFELVVGRFLQVLGAEVEFEPTGLGGVGVDWRARFPDGTAAYIEATSPVYNQIGTRERLRREALLGVIEEEAPAGWWIAPRKLPDIGLNDSRRELRGTLQRLFAGLPDPANIKIENRLSIGAPLRRGRIELEVWAGNPTMSPIAMASMGAYYDDSAVHVGDAVRAKRRQARAFPGEIVLLAIDAPSHGPDVESFDTSLLGRILIQLNEAGVTGYSFEADGALAAQRAAEYAGVLAFSRVSVLGANDPILYRHPRYSGALPGPFLDLRHRFLEGGLIAETPAARKSIMAELGFPKLGADD